MKNSFESVIKEMGRFRPKAAEGVAGSSASTAAGSSSLVTD